MAKNAEVQTKKRNLKLFPIYKMLAWDFLFFYTIDFLFLTQVKNISAADVVLKTTFYSLFGIILQIPANIMVEFLGRKNSMILGNILNCIYVLILILSRNLFDLIFAEFFSALAYAIKNIVETTLLSESIPPSRYKNKIFSDINSLGASRHYMLSAISKCVAGLLFQINGYLPMIFSLSILVIVVIISLFFIEPIENKSKNMGTEQFNEINKGFKFILKSERLKALIMSNALISALLAILSNYHVSILENIGASAVIIGGISALITLISSYASKREIKFHNKFRNKSLVTIALILSFSCIICGICGLGAEKYKSLLIIMIFSLLIYGFMDGMYYTIRDKYLGNFANKKINTKIYAVSQLFTNIAKVIAGLLASFLLDKMKTAYCMIVIGIIFTVFYILMEKYMRTRVGLKPEEYSEEERKYDELKLSDKI